MTRQAPTSNRRPPLVVPELRSPLTPDMVGRPQGDPPLAILDLPEGFIPTERARPDFSVSLELDEPDVLVPLTLTGNWRDSKVRFNITLESESPRFRADRTVISVLKRGEVIYSEERPDIRAPGTYAWDWDGYDNQDLLDTLRLMPAGPQVRVVVFKNGVTRADILELDNEPEIVDWIDLTVDLPAMRADVTVFFNFQNDDGMPKSDFARLVDLAKAGIGRYWSRNITVGGTVYAVTTTAMERGNRSIDIDLEYSNGSDFARSHNTGIIDATIVYNFGYYFDVATQEFPALPAKRQRMIAKMRADQEFLETAAHEFGHSVLEESAGKSTSYGHKGTSSIFQTPLPSSPGYPTTGEIDLMVYYNGRRPRDIYDRVIASEADVKRLIGLAAVDFDD